MKYAVVAALILGSPLILSVVACYCLNAWGALTALPGAFSELAEPFADDNPQGFW